MLLYLNRKFKESRDEEGFTLIELMIVVVIMGILAAVAIPIFAAQQKEATKATVKSDARNTVGNVGLALVKAPTASGFEVYSVGDTPTYTSITQAALPTANIPIPEGFVAVQVIESAENRTVIVNPLNEGDGALAAYDVGSRGSWTGYVVHSENTTIGYWYEYNSVTGEFTSGDADPNPNAGGGDENCDDNGGGVATSIWGATSNNVYAAGDCDNNGGGDNSYFDCGEYGYQDFGNGSRSAGDIGISSNASSCNYNVGSRNEQESEYQTDLGTPSEEESHNGCHWNYLGCMTDEDYANEGEVMWLNGAAEKEWYAENGTTIRYYYNNGGSEVNFFSPTANSTNFDGDSSYNDSLPNVGVNITHDFASYFNGGGGTGTFSNTCISDFNSNPFLDHSYTFDMYEGAGNDLYDCPRPYQRISVYANGITEDTAALSLDFKKMAENGGRIEFTNSQGETASITIAPNAWNNADPNAPVEAS